MTVLAKWIGINNLINYTNMFLFKHYRYRFVFLVQRLLNFKVDAKELSRLDIELKAWIDFVKDSEGNPKPQDMWLTTPQTCLLLRCSEITFYRKCKAGEIRHSKPSSIMVWLSDVAKYVIKKESFKRSS